MTGAIKQHLTKPVTEGGLGMTADEDTPQVVSDAANFAATILPDWAAI